MSQVHISGDDHTVTVNHDGGDLVYLIEKTQKLWDDTRPAARGLGRGYGFSSQIDPQFDYDRQQGHMRRPVRAEVTQ